MGKLALLNTLLRRTPVELTPKHSSLFKYFFRYKTKIDLHITLAELARGLPYENPTFLQIGANDGVSFDPIYPLTKELNLVGYCFEPIQEYYSQLKNNYADNLNIQPFQFAVGIKNADVLLYKVKSSSLLKYPKWAKGTSTLEISNLNSLGIKLDDVENEEVKMITYSKALKLCQIDCPNLLIIDTEGHDIAIIRSIDLNVHRPDIIMFEHFFSERKLRSEDFQEVLDKLFAAGYLACFDNQDILCYRPITR